LRDLDATQPKIKLWFNEFYGRFFTFLRFEAKRFDGQRNDCLLCERKFDKILLHGAAGSSSISR
jgi:hypothetical protein